MITFKPNLLFLLIWVQSTFYCDALNAELIKTTAEFTKPENCIPLYGNDLSEMALCSMKYKLVDALSDVDIDYFEPFEYIKDITFVCDGALHITPMNGDVQGRSNAWVYQDGEYYGHISSIESTSTGKLVANVWTSPDDCERMLMMI